MLADRFDAFFLDLDGVVYVGRQALPHTVPSLQRLRAAGKQIRFLTNATCATREQLVERLRNLGIEAHKEEILSAFWATCLYLREQGIRTVYSIGSPSVVQEFNEVGISIDEEHPEAVVVGCEEFFTYNELKQASFHIRRGAHFIATMVDATFPTPLGPAPTTGAIVSALQTATGQYPTVIGKPSPTMFLEAQKSLDGVDASRIVMIGDTPASDILGAHQAGLSALLISKAAPSTRLFTGARDLREPDGIIPDLAALFDEEYTIQPHKPLGYRWPQSIQPGVAAVVLNAEGQVLLVQRSDTGLWSLPTGHVEAGETVEEAITREIQEETGLQIRVERLSGVYSDPTTQVFSYPSGEVIHFITTCFRCTVTGGTLRSDRQETIEARFVDSKHLPDPFLPLQRRWLADALTETERAFIR
ncbi:HAD superfamily hydrolase (TIGR01450 family)/HAD superfamily hydrolase (TIGR01549 family) [Thermosporothrix hazakensis]|uniref:HAD superfamily hydrolase (TIGR01450 family)/HAD superfamily hydrolase (TIGR01549 family) n=2 Tax=Thermosporothrix TaxID=768650 RepID=A0A326UBS2_THEHA|nr:HAD-IIA family hydrolase [Thermosporothrix hazakensis]PZW34492.1 HAD superfamily hydrolase (TIGR01450 family)/HAD superfamily hydrolase (TIGR01549 family) [Thermosporothrix hazakensis]BBH85613.1 hypothetical protein KTC_03640 [Thermosporothrix sp. COM3]GCE45958.1 hypothetical protein KTH_08270 [Thermosporothrix hazakensis]